MSDLNDPLGRMIAFVVIVLIIGWLCDQATKPRRRPARRTQPVTRTPTVKPRVIKTKTVKSKPLPPTPPQPPEPTGQELMQQALAILEMEQERLRTAPINEILRRRGLNQAERVYHRTVEQIRMRFGKL